MQFATTAVLARLLGPSDFGLIGMAMVVIGFISLFKDLGTAAAVIQKKTVSAEFLSSIFYVNASIGLIATAALYFLAHLFSYLFRQPQIEPVLRLLSITFFISGISAVQQALLERELHFNKLAKIEMAATLIGCAVGIGAALGGYGVWSLAFQTLAGVTVKTALLWAFSNWRPSAVFRWNEIMGVSSYSLNLAGFSIFNYFSRNADNMLIGRFLGAPALGYYSLAYRIMLYPLDSISSVVSRVMFPLYSQIQSDDSKFRTVYKKIAFTISLVTFPMMLGLLVTARPFVLTFFGYKWEAAIPLIVILAPIGMIQSIATTVGSIYQAKGNTVLMFRCGILTSAAYTASFAVGLHWGITGVAAAYAIANILLIYPIFLIAFKLINLPVNDLIKTLWNPLLCSLMMAGVVFLWRLTLPAHMPNGLILTVMVSSGVAAYLIFSLVLNRKHFVEILSAARA